MREVPLKFMHQWSLMSAGDTSCWLGQQGYLSGKHQLRRQQCTSVLISFSLCSYNTPQW